MTDKTIGVLLLAAGRSKRFGTNKLLTRINDRPMLLETYAKYRQCFARICVIVNPDDLRVQQLLSEFYINYLECPHADQGMGTSLAFGIKQNPDWQGWVIALADMPYIQTHTLNKLNVLLHTHEIVAPVLKKQRGNPVGFSNHYYAELAQLSGEQGAKSVLQKNVQKVHLFNVDDQGIMLDIDKLSDVVVSRDALEY